MLTVERVAREWRSQLHGRSMRWQRGTRFNGLWLMVPWALSLLALSLCCWGFASTATATAVGPALDQHASVASSSQAPLDWLLTDRGPFHRAQDYVDFMERYRQGFTTRYRIYRWEAEQVFVSYQSISLLGQERRGQRWSRQQVGWSGHAATLSWSRSGLLWVKFLPSPLRQRVS